MRYGIREVFGMQVGMMREDPHMPQLMRDSGRQLFLVKHGEESGIEADPEGVFLATNGRDGDQHLLFRDYRRGDLHGNFDSFFQVGNNVFNLSGIVLQSIPSFDCRRLNHQNQAHSDPQT